MNKTQLWEKNGAKAREKQHLMSAMTTSYTFCSNQRQAIACDCRLKTKLYFSLQPLPIPRVHISHIFFSYFKNHHRSPVEGWRSQCPSLSWLLSDRKFLFFQNLPVPSRSQSQALHNLTDFWGCFDLQPLIPTSLMIQHYHPSKPHEPHLLSLHSQKNLVKAGGKKDSRAAQAETLQEDL